MAKKPNEVHLTFCIDGVAREQFQTLCKTYNVSASTVLREWVEDALKSGSIDKDRALKLKQQYLKPLVILTKR